MTKSTVIEIQMEPEGVGTINLSTTALMIIDMQRDFLLTGGFGEMLGNDVSKLQRAIQPCANLLSITRTCSSVLVIHTREGHHPHMKDVHDHKQRKGAVIGSDGPMGKILLRGEPGHDIIPELYPKPNEPIIDKPGKGSFYATDLECILQAQNISTIIVCGVTTEVCVHTTVREANDRGYYCIVVSDATASYNDTFHSVALDMISAQNGIFGSVATSQSIIDALEKYLSD